MHKKGQVYLLAAFLLVYILYSLTGETNFLHRTEEDKDFGEIARNYGLESAQFMNSLLLSNQAIADAFTNFTAVFTSYARTKNPQFGLIYALLHENTLYFGNYLDTDIELISPAYCCVPGCATEVPATIAVAGLHLELPVAVSMKGCVVQLPGPPPPGYEFGFRIEGTTFKTKLTPNNPEVAIVARAKKGGDVLVYSQGRFMQP